jgi:hypothetical protein
VLKPGARVALAAWAAREDNPWTTLPPDELIARGLDEPPQPGPGQFAWAGEGTIAAALEDAGFTELAVDAVEFEYRYPSAEDWLQTTMDMSKWFADSFERLDEATAQEVRAALVDTAGPYAREDGVAFPARTWVAWATA